MNDIRNLLFTLLLISTAGILFAQQPVDIAHQADEHYRAGNYSLAIDSYEQVIASGFSSAELYYNLGNAYYRENQMGLAILNYERALRLKPYMSDAKENLAFAQSHTSDRITEIPKLFVVRWVESLTTQVDSSLWRWVLVGLLVLAGCAVVLLVLGRSRSWRKTGLVVLIIVIPLLLADFLLLLGTTSHYNARREAVVIPQSVVIKSSPEEQSVDKMILHEGTLVTVQDSLSGWYKIEIADGTTGWCVKSDIVRI